MHGQIADSFWAARAVRRTACCHRLWLLPDARASGEGFFYPLADVFLAADAMDLARPIIVYYR
jgi:hypothetical protein